MGVLERLYLSFLRTADFPKLWLPDISWRVHYNREGDYHDINGEINQCYFITAHESCDGAYEGICDGYDLDGRRCNCTRNKREDDATYIPKDKQVGCLCQKDDCKCPINGIKVITFIIEYNDKTIDLCFNDPYQQSLGDETIVVDDVRKRLKCDDVQYHSYRDGNKLRMLFQSGRKMISISFRPK